VNATRIRFFDAPVCVAVGLLAIPVLPAVITACLHPSKPSWSELRQGVTAELKDRVDAVQARRDYKDALWLDARSKSDFQAAHVPGASPLTEDTWEEQLPAVMERWDGRQPMLVYCGGASCQASEAVARRLRRELVEVKVLILTGGWPAWLAEEARK
jgi:rhodanese-related sulfurtransferase